MDTLKIMERVRHHIGEFMLTLGSKLDGESVVIKRDTRGMRLIFPDGLNLVINGTTIMVENGKATINNEHTVANVGEVLDLIKQGLEKEIIKRCFLVFYVDRTFFP